MNIRIVQPNLTSKFQITPKSERKEVVKISLDLQKLFSFETSGFRTLAYSIYVNEKKMSR